MDDLSYDSDAFDSDLADGIDTSDVPDVSEVDYGEDAALDDAFAEVDFDDIEMVEDTDVANFNESELTTTEEVANYMEESIPEEHLDGLDSIEYVDDELAYQEGLMGMWIDDPETDIAHIEVYPHDDVGIMYDTVAHEIGHNAEETLEPDLLDDWNDLYEQSDLDEFVTPYASESAQEDFAETYSFYINDPPLVQATSPDKYDFMKDNVFDGKEF